MVELFADDACGVVRVHHQVPDLALLVDHADHARSVAGGPVLLPEQGGVLVEEHPRPDARHVEAVQEVLDAVLRGRVDGVRLLQLQHPLRHQLDGVLVPAPDRLQGLDELAQGLAVALLALVCAQLHEALGVHFLKGGGKEKKGNVFASNYSILLHLIR